MIALYLDEALDEEEIEAVEEAVGDGVECRRVPWLWPSSATPAAEPETDGNPKGGNSKAPMAATLLPHLQRLDLPDDGNRLLLVPPRDPHWSTALAEAIRLETGTYPVLVQTERQQAELGRPGPLRLLDMEAYYLDGDTNCTPPWLENDETSE